jgi:glycosyltransferase involved in cell wall biosynthesis
MTAEVVDLALSTLGDQINEHRQPRVYLGMPLYNQREFLEDALQSILAQTYGDFRLIILDDSTDPAPGKIVQRYAAKDGRISYIKNVVRKGLVDNWRACFRHAGEVDYFAWVSDHDVWHPEWLEKMVRVLNASPDTVLVYPLCVRITAAGERIEKPPRYFSTEGMNERRRIRAVCRDARYYGKMVYGLFRASALRQAGVYRRVLFPDVVLLFELSLQGDFSQVEEELWFLRQVAKFSIARQKKSLFVRKPWYIYLPWPFVNAVVVGWNAATISGTGKLEHPYLGFEMAFWYLYRFTSRMGEGSWIGSYHDLTRLKTPWIRKLACNFQVKRQSKLSKKI